MSTKTQVQQTEKNPSKARVSGNRCNIKETTLFSLCENGRSLCFPRIYKLGDQMIKQLLNSVIAKLNIVICHCLACVQTPLPSGKIKEEASVIGTVANHVWELFYIHKKYFCGCDSCFMSFQFSKCWCMSPTYFHRAIESSERFLKLVYSILSKKNVLASPYY